MTHVSFMFQQSHYIRYSRGKDPGLKGKKVVRILHVFTNMLGLIAFRGDRSWTYYDPHFDTSQKFLQDASE